MRSLIIGYGNPYRRDDGVGFHVLSEVAKRLGRPPLGLDDDGLDDLGQDVDFVCLPQLMPELAETIIGYGQVIFVDAHTGAFQEDLRCEPVNPMYVPSAFTHHMKPETLLGLSRLFSERIPDGHVISVRGNDFDMGVQLSAETECLAQQAVDCIMDLVAPSADTPS